MIYNVLTTFLRPLAVVYLVLFLSQNKSAYITNYIIQALKYNCMLCVLRQLISYSQCLQSHYFGSNE